LAFVYISTPKKLTIFHPGFNIHLYLPKGALVMRARPVFRFESPSKNVESWLLVWCVMLLLPAAALAQGSGRESIGNGGRHVIQGKIFFPSGRRAEGSIQIRLESLGSGEITTMADSSGSFVFTGLNPGNYTVVVNAGKEYEISREAVTIDSDLNLSRVGLSVNTGTKRYTVFVTLQPKHDDENRNKPAVINAALAEVPEAARNLYQHAMDLGRDGQSARAIEDLKAAISIYPKFPLALNELGVQYLKLGQAANAVEPLKSAVKLSPDSFTPKLNLGVALLETQKFADAESELRAAIKINSAPTAHMYLGLTLAHLSNDAEAETELKAAVELSNNQLALAHYYLGGLYWKKLKYQRAADELETFLRLSPNAPDAERLKETIKTLRKKQ
jgi:Tfp pilus assembly protein PilF